MPDKLGIPANIPARAEMHEKPDTAKPDGPAPAGADNAFTRFFDLGTGSYSVVFAGVLWLIFWTLGAHRLYVGRIYSGLIMAALTILAWWLLFIGFTDPARTAADGASPIPRIGAGFALYGLLLVWWLADGVLLLRAGGKALARK